MKTALGGLFRFAVRYRTISFDRSPPGSLHHPGVNPPKNEKVPGARCGGLLLVDSDGIGGLAGSDPRTDLSLS